MNKVAKVVIIDKDDKYLMMHRSEHPRFGIDPDLPGGTLEDNEMPLEALIREVREEIGVDLSKAGVKEVYSGADYSAHKTYYILFTTMLNNRPEIHMSWEHSSYEWVDFDSFLKSAKGAKDTYMHMVYDTLIKE